MKKYFLCFISFFLVSCTDHTDHALTINIKDVKQQESLNLFVNAEKLPHTIKIQILGKIDGDARVEIFNKEGLQKTVNIDKGAVNLRANMEWYSDSCVIKYIPSANLTMGELKIEYELKYIK